jgi:thiosulfate/3-mercaptopyruvate sulfurtransferase
MEEIQMHYSRPEALVSTEWLAQHLDDPEVAVIDASWYLPWEKGDAKADYRTSHIPGAVYFDIDDICDKSIPLPHMLPSPSLFAEKVGALGLGTGLRMIAYDSGSLMASCRAWWMFRLFGYDDVAVLDGGFAKWTAENRPVESGEVVPVRRTFTPRPRPELARDADAMLANVKSRRDQVLDARSRGRFDATEPESRPGLRGGHIPGSLSLPYPDVLDPETRRLLPADRLKTAFEAAGVELSRPAVGTCGSGVSACVLALGLHLLGHDQYAVYDGSWTEWGSRPDTPIET